MIPFILIINHRNERVLCLGAVVDELRCPFVIGEILNGLHLIQRVLFSASTTVDEWIDFDIHFNIFLSNECGPFVEKRRRIDFLLQSFVRVH